MKFKTVYILLLLPILSCACSETKTEIETITEFIDQPTDTLHHIGVSVVQLDKKLTADLLPEDRRPFNIHGIYTHRGELFCSNFDAKRVDIFSMDGLEYKGSFAEGMGAKDLFADDRYIFVTGLSNPTCQVSVYDRVTRDYICRLGNGSWGGPLTHPIGVAANDRYVFVRDQSEIIKVFLRSEIASGKSLSRHCTLNIDKSQAWNNENFSFGIAGNVLYALDNRSNTIYTYNVGQDFEKGKEYPYTAKLRYADNRKPMAFAATGKYIFIGSPYKLHVYKQDEEAITNLDETLSVITSLGGKSIENILSLAASGDTLLMSTGRGAIIPLLIKEQCYDIITPIEK